MKKFISLLLTVIMALNILPLSVASAETQFVEVTKDSAPIRDDYYESGNVLKWVPRGTILRVYDTKLNSKLNHWFRVEYDDPSQNRCIMGWIYSGNVKDHSHSYQKYEYNGNTFCVCETCNTISIEKVTTVPLSKMDSVALAIPSAIGTAMVDSPAIGPADIAAVFILIMAAFEIGTEPQMTEVIEMVDTMDLSRFTEGTNRCGIDSFYKVQRLPAGLKKIDNTCMNMMQAFICVKYNLFDVWTETQEAAGLCAAINGDFYGPEIDATGDSSYYYHFHLGADRKHKERTTNKHIFFGTNGLGQRPQ